MRNDLILATVVFYLYEACSIDDVSRGSISYLFVLVNFHWFVCCVVR